MTTSVLLAEYEKRLAQRDINANNSVIPKKVISIDPIKFKPSGEINTFFGLTCIVWIDPGTKLFQGISAYQRAIKNELDQAGLGKFFSFLKPGSFHMTICDIVANSAPIQSKKASKIIDQIHKSFSSTAKTEVVSCRIQGVGLSSTITALVRFETEEELRKILFLEQLIKDATRVNLRNFTGHITLAYGVSDIGEAEDNIKKILQSKMMATFGNFVFSQFDLACFTDMNTYIPLVSINLESGQITHHQNTAECQFS